MTRSEREQLIERYLSGEMSSAEEGEFFIQVALDSELRLDLKAHRTIDSAIRKERETVPAEHTALRGRMASMLAATPGLAQISTERVSRSAPDRPQLRRERMIDRLRTRMTPFQWFLATATAAALTLGSVMMPTGDTGVLPVTGVETPNSIPADGGTGNNAATRGKSNSPVVQDGTETEVQMRGAASDGSSGLPLEMTSPPPIASERQSPGLLRKRQTISRAESRAPVVKGRKSRDGELRRSPVDPPSKQEGNGKEKIEVRIRINPNGGAK